MVDQQPKTKKAARANVNPNWALLQEKLKNDASKWHKSDTSLLGKRKEWPGQEDLEQSTVNPLIPTSDDCTITNALAMDCEMVGVGANRSALGRVTLVNEYGNVVYDEYVRPIEHVVDFRTEISGIRPHHLKKAKNFQVAQNKVAEMLHGRILVGHALHNDLKALLLSHPKNDMRDTSDYLPFLREGKRRSLRNLAEEILGVKIQNGEHCSIEDARAAMLIYQKNKKKWEKTVKDQSRHPKKNHKGRSKKMRRFVEDAQIRRRCADSSKLQSHLDTPAV